ncbi:protein kinase 4 isoform X2 [Condylostylus longicornis]|nr:protein kinase 4 isoform X2 [Condylostylus longicornis]
MIDHQPTTPIQTNNDLQFGFNSITGLNQQQLTLTGNINNENIFNFQHSNSNSNISSTTSMNEYNNIASAKIQQQKRLRNLNQMLQQRLQKEIRDTDERIRRYSEQQFALLKNFREKSEQEYQLLVSLVNQVPDELKVIDAIDDNTITANNILTTMKTNDNTDSDNSTTILNVTNKNSTILTKQAATSAKTKGAIQQQNTQNETDQQQQPPSLLVFNKSLNQNHSSQQSQIPNIETPPGTPENVPMSVGNSPTFRPHHQQQNQYTIPNTQQRPNTLLNNSNDDCLFELDDFEVYQGTDQSQNMSDVEECEDAADALGELSAGMSIPKNMGRRGSNSIAKSLPIKIANMGGSTTKYDFEDLDDGVVDDTVDIAASIKALAKSVHGNAVFGELPRPRFSTQI